MKTFFVNKKITIILFLIGFWLSSWGLLGHIHANKFSHSQCQTCVSQAQLGAVLLHATPVSLTFNQTIATVRIFSLTGLSVSFTAPYFQRGPPTPSFPQT